MILAHFAFTRPKLLSICSPTVQAAAALRSCAPQLNNCTALLSRISNTLMPQRTPSHLCLRIPLTTRSLMFPKLAAQMLIRTVPVLIPYIEDPNALAPAHLAPTLPPVWGSVGTLSS